MNSDERTRLWVRDTRGLRVMSGVVGAVAVLVAVVQAALLMRVCTQMGAGIWPTLMALVPPLLILISGLFVMYAGRVLASIAEIAWFSSLDNSDNRPEDGGPST